MLILTVGCGGRAVGDEGFEQAVPSPPSPPPGMTCFASGETPRWWAGSSTYEVTTASAATIQRDGVGVRFLVSARHGDAYTQLFHGLRMDVLGPPGSQAKPALWVDIWAPPKGWQIAIQTTTSHACWQGAGPPGCWQTLGLSSVDGWFQLSGSGPRRATLCMRSTADVSASRQVGIYVSRRLE